MQCDDGYLPDKARVNVCGYNNATQEFEWSEAEEDFSCVPQVGLLVGGIGHGGGGYLSSVEAFAPSQGVCHGFEMAEYPLKIMGAVAEFVNGRGVVCGGATQAYVECSTGPNG